MSLVNLKIAKPVPCHGARASQEKAGRFQWHKTIPASRGLGLEPALLSLQLFGFPGV
jgi:hypothetical protein